jgi:hypothetical protein
MNAASGEHRPRCSALIIARDYWGTQTGVSTADLFADFLVRDAGLGAPGASVTRLTGPDVTVPTVRSAITDFVARVNASPPSVGYVYLAGHGGQVPDGDGSEDDGCDEVFALPDGNLTDDWLAHALSSVTDPRSLVVVVSDHCSSGSMLDRGGGGGAAGGGRWVSVGSSLDREDSYAGGDGNIMTVALVAYLRSLGPAALAALDAVALAEGLASAMLASYIGDLQHASVAAASDACWRAPLFPGAAV